MLLIKYKDGDETEWHVWFMFVYGSYIMLSTSGLTCLHKLYTVLVECLDTPTHKLFCFTFQKTIKYQIKGWKSWSE